MGIISKIRKNKKRKHLEQLERMNLVHLYIEYFKANMGKIIDDPEYGKVDKTWVFYGWDEELFSYCNRKWLFNIIQYCIEKAISDKGTENFTTVRELITDKGPIIFVDVRRER